MYTKKLICIHINFFVYALKKSWYLYPKKFDVYTYTTRLLFFYVHFRIIFCIRPPRICIYINFFCMCVWTKIWYLYVQKFICIHTQKDAAFFAHRCGRGRKRIYTYKNICTYICIHIYIHIYIYICIYIWQKTPSFPMHPPLPSSTSLGERGQIHCVYIEHVRPSSNPAMWRT